MSPASPSPTRCSHQGGTRHAVGAEHGVAHSHDEYAAGPSSEQSMASRIRTTCKSLVTPSGRNTAPKFRTKCVRLVKPSRRNMAQRIRETCTRLAAPSGRDMGSHLRATRTGWSRRLGGACAANRTRWTRLVKPSRRDMSGTSHDLQEAATASGRDTEFNVFIVFRSEVVTATRMPSSWKNHTEVATATHSPGHPAAKGFSLRTPMPREKERPQRKGPP